MGKSRLFQKMTNIINHETFGLNEAEHKMSKVTESSIDIGVSAESLSMSVVEAQDKRLEAIEQKLVELMDLLKLTWGK